MESTAISVKPLDWEFREAIPDRRYAEWKCYSLLGVFVIFDIPGEIEWYLIGSEERPAKTASVEQAKRDAQAFFDQRILSVIATAASPVNFAAVSAALDIDWHSALKGSVYPSPESFLADIATRMTTNVVPALNPLNWEHSGGGFYRATAPLFGSLRVENYGEHYSIVYSVPGFSDTFVEGKFDDPELALAAAEEEYRKRMSVVLGITVSPAPKCLADHSSDAIPDDVLELARHAWNNPGSDPVRAIALAIMAGK